MPSNNRFEDNDPHSSGYEGDVSDQVSIANTVVDRSKSSKPTQNASDDNDKNSKPEAGTICIGCDARDAGPGVTNDEDAEFGTIWIGCSIRDMGFSNYQEYLTSDERPTTQHIEDVDKSGESKSSNKQASEGEDNGKESQNCKQ